MMIKAKVLALLLGFAILLIMIDMNKGAIPSGSQVDDKGRKVTIYVDGKAIHTYEKYVKVVGDEVIFKNDYTEMKFKNAKVKYGE
jgi:hypothetical protein